MYRYIPAKELAMKNVVYMCYIMGIYLGHVGDDSEDYQALQGDMNTLTLLSVNDTKHLLTQHCTE